MSRSLIPKRGVFVPTAVMYHPDLTPQVLFTWIQLRGLAWGRSETPPLRLQLLLKITRKGQTALYDHMSQLRSNGLLTWRNSGPGTLIFTFNDELLVDRTAHPPDTAAARARYADYEQPGPLEAVPNIDDVDSEAADTSPALSLEPQMDNGSETGTKISEMQVLPAAGLNQGMKEPHSEIPETEDQDIEIPESATISDFRNQKSDFPDPAHSEKPESLNLLINQEEKNQESKRILSFDHSLIQKKEKDKEFKKILSNYLINHYPENQEKTRLIRELTTIDPLPDPEEKRGYGGEREIPEYRKEYFQSASEAVKLYTAVTGIMPEPGKAEKICRKVSDLEVWEDTIRHYQGHGWNPGNLGGLLELYRRGGGKGCFFCGTR